MEAADRGTIGGTVASLVSIDEHIVGGKEVVEVVNLAPVKEDITRYHVGLEDEIFDIARIHACQVSSRIHQEATVENGIRRATSGIIPVSAKILVPG
jgi:hypothetical protein